MNGTYLGTLSRADPLYEVLALKAYPDIRDPVLHVDWLSAGHLVVYRYAEEGSRRTVVGKFFRLDDPNPHKVARLKGEFGNLVWLLAHSPDVKRRGVISCRHV